MAKFKFDAVIRLQVHVPEGLRTACIGASAIPVVKLIAWTLTGAFATYIAVSLSTVLPRTGWSLEALSILMLDVAR